MVRSAIRTSAEAPPPFFTFKEQTNQEASSEESDSLFSSLDFSSTIEKYWERPVGELVAVLIVKRGLKWLESEGLGTPEKKTTWFNMVQPSLNLLCDSKFVRAMVLVGGLNPQ